MSDSAIEARGSGTAPGADPVISLRGLEKRYGSVRALAELNLDVPPGAVGLLGPNGAGKTTLIKLLLGLLNPNAGTAQVLGLDPVRRRERLRVREVVGYMPEGDCLLPGMTGVELVSTLGRITGLSRQDSMTRTHEVLDYVQLEEQRYRKLEEYSTGMKQRLKLAQALVHDPPLLLLDEPTNGLDPKGRRQMLTLVADLGRNQGKHILLCSHLLPDVEQACDHVVVLNRGRAVAQGRISEMTAGDEHRLRLRVEGHVEEFSAALGARGIPFTSTGDGQLSVALEGAATDADELFALAQDSGAWFSFIDEQRSTLEDVFLRAVETAPADAGELPATP